MDAKRITISGKAIPLRGNDIDTDRIIPARYLRCVTFDGVGEHAFEDDRAQLKQKGKTHPFDDPRFAGAEILFVSKNFGCGSSREHAPQSIMRWGQGIKAIVGESFAEIFLGNCTALGIPCVVVDQGTIQNVMDAAETKPDTVFTLDIAKLTLSFDEETVPVNLDKGLQTAFIEGRWDSTAELMGGRDAIAATAERLPYFDHWK